MLHKLFTRSQAAAAAESEIANCTACDVRYSYTLYSTDCIVRWGLIGFSCNKNNTV